MMKRRIAVFCVCLTALLYFSGCNNDVTNAPKNGNNEGPEEETGSTKPATQRLTSAGLAEAGSTTYFIDFARGNDDNDGTSHLTPWKSLKNANGKVFEPGDHILLEVDSVWNGDPVTTSNRNTLLTSDKVGMLWPKGDGTADKPIVLDFYKHDDAAPTFESSKRPIINGNGTPSLSDLTPYDVSGTITLENLSCWEIRNIEVTNTFQDPVTEPDHWYNFTVRKALAGILVTGTGTPQAKKLYIGDCYVHDVQSEHDNNGKASYTSTYFGGGTHGRGKGNGGIIIGHSYDGLSVERNIVKRVGLEGLRTAGGSRVHTNVVFRNNYVETIAGDGIVMARTYTTNDEYRNIVEYNIIKDSCAGPNLTTGNYAGAWAYSANGVLFRYNECYGILYGWADGQAWDIDNECDRMIYEYNYSHHNAGGTVLFMSGITNGIFRYNIGANDGGGSRYMEKVAQNGLSVNTAANSYTDWTTGKAFIHYVPTTKSADRSTPLVYNNTFYIGDGITVGVFGHDDTGEIEKYIRFYNNILLKEGTGTVYLVRGYENSGTGGHVYNNAGFKNNMLWAPNQNQFSNGKGTSIADLIVQQSNIWADPQLVISEPGMTDTLRKQRDNEIPNSAGNSPSRLETFTGLERLRARASIFTPKDGSPVIGAGMSIPAGNNAIDGAWNAYAIEKDMFGSDLDFAHPPIGAASKRYTTTLNPAE